MVYYLAQDDVVGMMQDDAWYVLLAQAIASGKGYTLTNAPSAGIHPLYPPVFPFVLSLVFRFFRDFPANIKILKLVSVISMFLAGIASFWFYRKLRSHSMATSVILAATILFSPGLVFMASSTLLSECLFLALLMWTVLVTEYCLEYRLRDRFGLLGIVAGVLVSLLFLSRSIAVAMIFAAVIFFLRERLYRVLTFYLATVILLAGSWTVYSWSHKPSVAQRNEVNGYIVIPYTEQFWHRVAGDQYSGTATILDIPARIIGNLSEITFSEFGAILIPPLYPIMGLGLKSLNYLQILLSLVVTLVCLAGLTAQFKKRLRYAELGFVLSILIILCWPFTSYRYVLPLLPLMLIYFVEGLRAVYLRHLQFMQQKTTQEVSDSTAYLAVATLLVTLVGQVDFIYRSSTVDELGRERKLTRLNRETVETMGWIRENISSSEIILSDNPALVHLYTGNRAVYVGQTADRWELWKQLGIRYLVYVSPSPMPDAEFIEKQFPVRYRSKGELNSRVIDLGRPDLRRPWDKVGVR